MTDLQTMMLAICFGAVIGIFIGNLIVIIKFAVDNHREKKRIRKESKDKQ